MEWVKTLNHAIDYIENNITGEITCDDIAKHVYLSSFHFQRTFTLMTGFTVGEYIRNRRLSLAGHELLSGNEKVIDIALKYGYDTPESFSRAFRRYHGVAPMEAKKKGTILKAFNRLVIKIILEGGSSMDYKIVEKEAFKVVIKSRVFQNETSNTEIPKFWNEYFREGLGNLVCGMMGICIQAEENSQDWMYGIGCEKQYVKEIPDGFETLEIPANTWAIFKCVGAMPNAIQDMWKRVYGEWLPSSNFEMVPSYDIEYYTDGDTSKDDYVSEIWIPVKEKK